MRGSEGVSDCNEGRGAVSSAEKQLRGAEWWNNQLTAAWRRADNANLDLIHANKNLAELRDRADALATVVAQLLDEGERDGWVSDLPPDAGKRLKEALDEFCL